MKGTKALVKKVIAMMVLVIMVFQCGLGAVGVAAEESQPVDTIERSLNEKPEAIDSVTILAETIHVDSEGKPIMKYINEVGEGEIKKDAKVEMRLAYKPSKLATKFNLGDTITYQLPSGIKILEQQSGDVYDVMDVVGEYVIGTDGKITITISNEDYLKKKNGRLKDGTVSFDGQLDNSAWGEGGTQTIVFGEEEYTIHFEEDPVNVVGNLTVTKSIDTENQIKFVEGQANEIPYKIVVEADPNNTMDMEDVTVNDVFTNGAEYLTLVPDSIETDGSSLCTANLDENGNWDGTLDWTRIGTLTPGESCSMTFKVTVNDSIFAAGETGNRQIVNVAKAYSNGDLKNECELVTDTISGLDIEKSNSVYTYDESTNRATVEYTVKVKAPANNTWPISGVSVTDEFSDNKSFVVEYNDIHVSDGITNNDYNSQKKLEWNIGEIKPGEEKTLTYTVVVNGDILLGNSGNHNWDTGASLKNIAILKVNNREHDRDENTVKFRKVWIWKNGSQVQGNPERIKFVIHANETTDGAPVLNGPVTFTDELYGDWAYCDDEGFNKVIINCYTSGPSPRGALVESFEFDPNEEQYRYTGKNEEAIAGWIVSSGDHTFSDSEGYYYEIEYYAEYTGTKVGTPSISNTAGIGIGIGGTTYDHYASWSGSSSDYNNMEKYLVSVSREQKTASWRSEITTDIPTGAVYIDERVIDSGGWTFTDEQIQGIKVYKLNSNNEKVSFKDKVTIARTGDSSFKITFKEGIAASEQDPLYIEYDCTLDTNGLKPAEQREYKNRGKLQVGNLYDTSTKECTYTQERRILKSAGNYNPTTGELIWTIKVNEHGTMRGTATITDVLPEGLEFADPDVAVIDRHGSAAGDTRIESVTLSEDESGNEKVTIQLSGLNKTENSNAYVDIKLKTKVNKELLLTNFSTTFVNDASIKYEGEDSNSTTRKDINNTVLTKNGEYDRSTAPYVNYTINFNPNGIDMLDGKELITITDTMGSNLTLKPGSLEIVSNGQKVDPQNLRVEGNVFYFDVPDNMPLTITYKAYALGEISSHPTITNTVTYGGEEVIGGYEDERSVVIFESKATMTGPVGFIIFKGDKYGTNPPIEGAKFELYKVNTADGKLELVQTECSNESGTVEFFGEVDPEEGPKGLDEKGLYAFKETSPATGYYLDSENAELTYVVFKEATKNLVNENILQDEKKVSDILVLQPGTPLPRYNELNTTTSITFEGTKTLSNANYSLEEDDYAFKITGPNLKNGEQSVESLIVGNNAGDNGVGAIKFPTINYELSDLEGATSKTYSYTINEVKPTDEAEIRGGINYSTDVYVVEVTVEKNTNNGTINASITGVTKNGNALEINNDSEKPTFDFVNTYHADDVTDTIEGVKITKGLALRAEDYEFEMKEVTAEGKISVATVKNDADGKFEFNLPKYTVKDHGKTFTYEVTEVKGDKPGMTYDETVYTVTVAIEDDMNGKLHLTKSIAIGETSVESGICTFTNEFNGSVKLTKTNGKADDEFEVLAGAKFALIKVKEDGTEEQVGEYTTCEDGTLEVNELSEGAYYFKEIQPPAGYSIITDEYGAAVKYEFQLGPHGGDAVDVKNITVGNEQKLGTLSLIKKDVDSAALIEGAEFELYKDGELYQTGLITDAEGKITVTALPWGDYYFVETVPAPGYIYDATPTETITVDAAYVDGEPVTVEKTNKQTELYITKTDISGENLVSGSFIEIFKMSRARGELEEEPVVSWLSDGTNHLIKGELSIGETYILKETKAPVGYGYISSYIEFYVNADGTIETAANYAIDENGNKVFLVQDDIIDLKVSKIDFETEKVLEGAVLAIYDKETGEEMERWTSDKDGHYDFGKSLHANKTYVLKELKAPEGYNKIEDVEFSVLNEGQIDIITKTKFVKYEDGHMSVYNCKVEEVDTGDHTPLGMSMILMTLAMIGMVSAAMPRKRRSH